MSGLNLQIVALTLPEGFEFPGLPQAMLDDMMAPYLSISGAEDFIGVAYGSTEPDADSRDLWWARTDGSGNPVGWYAWDGAAWSPLPIITPSGATGSRPSSPTDGTQYFDTTIKTNLIYYDGSWHTMDGSPGDVKFVTAATLADAIAQNPGWVHYTDGIGKVFAGALADGSDQGDDVGSNTHTNTIAEMPAHTHEDIQLTGSEADNGDAGTFVITASTQSVGVETIAASSTGSKGDGDDWDIRQATKILFCLQKS
jgi:hypothetical protein